MTSEPDSLDEKLGRVNRALWIDRGIVGKLEAVTALQQATRRGLRRGRYRAGGS